MPRTMPTSAHEIVMIAFARDAARPSAKDDLGPLPEWNLTDLYPGMDAPEFKRDLAHADAESKAFAAAYQGKLATLLSGQDPSGSLHEAIARYERLDEVMGRLMSYVGLVYAGDTSDPVR
ncbi:MAG: oligoendopeptidase F, partial [Hyphomicrobiales bacterium]|nr:oligoendopeptidase F [Hyphomicrobiales bacterium]